MTSQIHQEQEVALHDGDDVAARICEEEWWAENLCPLLRRADGFSITMKIDGVRYNRPGSHVESLLAPLPTARDYPFTATQRLYIQDYISRVEGKTPGGQSVRDKLLLAHLNIAMTDKERAAMVRKGPAYAIKQKVLGGDRCVLPQTRPLGSLTVRQLSPCPPDEVKRPNSAAVTPSEFHGERRKIPRQKSDSRCRKTGIYSRFQTAVDEDQFNEKQNRIVHFADNLPKVKPGDPYNCNGQGGLCGCSGNGNDGKVCACPRSKSEMVLPKIDLTSAIEDGVRATVHAILSNSSRPYLSQKEEAVLTLLSSQEFGEKKPEQKRIPRRLPARRLCTTPRQNQAGRNSKVSSKAQKLVADGTLIKKPEEWKVSLMDTLAVPGSLEIGFDKHGVDKKTPRVPCSACHTDYGYRQSLKLKTFEMALPS